MSEDRVEILVSARLTPQRILAPDKNRNPNFKAQEIWVGEKDGPGLKDKLEKDGKTDKMIQDLEQNKDLLGRTITRYNQLRALTVQNARDRNVLDIRFKKSHETMLVTTAYNLEKSGLSFAQRAQNAADNASGGDTEKANLIYRRIIDNFVNKEHDILRELANRIAQNSLTKGDRNRRIQEVQFHPRFKDWAMDKQSWIQLDSEGKKAILEKYTKLHPNTVAATIRHREQPDYLYIFLKPHSESEKGKNKRKTKGVNEAQGRLEQRIAKIPDVSAISAMPTQELRNVFQELDTIGSEIKIHIQPKQGQQPMVIDRMLDLLDKNPELRDRIDAIKVRIDNHGTADDLGNALPETVFYTNDESEHQITGALQKEFVDVEGNRKIPRFNQEVSGGFLYKAQSGGDIKGFLASKGILDKFFDRESNYSKLRV